MTICPVPPGTGSGNIYKLLSYKRFAEWAQVARGMPNGRDEPASRGTFSANIIALGGDL